ncbi:hypothetical protein CQW23_25647 [Capsicum baccatum]|uniref:Dynamin stalk domain-containing protein n=1 Tax=Capsicum baccatum TaxID=33114 RepID=A0A2G2VLL4_CAPBA|nr:hypothetical protein CQW23_25647 [Capsicum baccatum]
MKESETIEEYSNKLLNLENHLRLLGSTFNDSRIVEKILVTVPERFEATITTLENTKDLSKITVADLLRSFQAQEQRLGRRPLKNYWILGLSSNDSEDNDFNPGDPDKDESVKTESSIFDFTFDSEDFSLIVDTDTLQCDDLIKISHACELVEIRCFSELRSRLENVTSRSKVVDMAQSELKAMQVGRPQSVNDRVEAAVEKELRSYRERLESKGERGAMLLNILTKYSEAFFAEVDDKSQAMTTKELSGGERIHHIFQSIFVKSLKRQIARLLDPSLQCLRFVYDELLRQRIGVCIS